jgi:maltooligosyltrehalose trehalohydrolase
MRRNHVMPFGTELHEDGSVRFRLWAPQAQVVELCLDGGTAEHLLLNRLEQGWFELRTRAAASGSHYRFRIDGKSNVPDPASRFQPCDVDGPSQVINPQEFDWHDADWRGRPWEDTVIYELHVGAFTQEGSFQAVEQKLDYLSALGVTALELMPVADFPGQCNWGYDGVLLYAPDSAYGRPEDLKRLIQAAHAKGMMVFLDVVYNHFGPYGNYLGVYSPQFFTDRHRTPWGDAINFDGPENKTVREFFIHNSLYWLEEYHFDGLRFDAVEAIADDSTPDILTELARCVRQKFEGERRIHLMLENGDNAVQYLRRDRKNRVQLYDAQWNDDIHHSLHVLITGETDGYYCDYGREPIQQLGRCLAEGFAYQGEYSEYHGKQRGTPSGTLPPSAFISFLQNHDQVGNRAFGERILRLAPPEAVRAAMEILLLAPAPPLLFMGEEFGATSPFLFFCDFQGDLALSVTTGRRNEFARFSQFRSMETRHRIPDPNAEESFRRSKLNWDRLTDELHASWLQLYRRLLSIRRRVVAPRLAGVASVSTRYSKLQNLGLAVDWKLGDRSVLKLCANLGRDWLTTRTSQLGGLFYSSSEEAANALVHNRLAPWSVIWIIQTCNHGESLPSGCADGPEDSTGPTSAASRFDSGSRKSQAALCCGCPACA